MAAISFGRKSHFLPVVSGLILLAWLTLLIWERSPYGRYIEHGQWTELGLASSICRVLPAGSVVLPALLYVSGWVLMTVAMMLPTVLPLLGIFGRLTEGRSDRRRLRALVIAGYLAVWVLFGATAHVLDAALHGLAGASTWLTFNSWLIGACVLALAGGFQFSRLKHHCLDKCRTPFSFVNQHWRGHSAGWQAFALGGHHGLYCVGCCWAIMLLMFVVGTGSVGWMLALGAVMAIEKNMPWGARLSMPLGIALLVCAAGVVAVQVWR
jgi:predicted metal-binding membrane protein